MKQSNVKINFLFNFSYQILAFLIPLITTPYISRVLSAEGIGRYSYSYSIAYYFVMFTLLGISNYGNRNVARLRNNYDELSKFVCNAIGLKFIIGAILLIIYLGFSIYKQDIVTLIFSLYVLSALFDISWLFFGLEEFKITVVRNTILKILATLSIFCFVKEKNDLYIYTIIMVSELLLSQLYLWRYIKRYIKFVKPSIEEMKKQIIPNLVLFVPVIAVSLYKMMDKTMLGYMTGNVEVGYYESSAKIMAIPVGFIVALGTVMLPRISNLRSLNDQKKIDDYFSKGVFFAATVSSLLSLGIVGVAKEFVPLYFGEGYEKCVILFFVLLPTCIFQSIANVIRTQYLIPFNEDTIYIKSVSLGAITNLIINFILIPKYQSIGAAIGTFFAEFIVCWYQCYKIKNEINVFKYIKQSIPPILVAIIMCISLLSINLEGSLLYQLIIKILLGAIIYLILLIIVYFPTIKKMLTESRRKND